MWTTVPAGLFRGLSKCLLKVKVSVRSRLIKKGVTVIKKN